jgi:hypothetical protein
MSISYEIVALLSIHFNQTHEAYEKIITLVTGVMSVAILLPNGPLVAKSLTTKAPLANVSVLVKGASTGTTTNIDGTYSLTVPANAKTLVFSFVNMTTQEAAINSSNVSVSLSAATRSMDEVIVVAYGTVKKSDFTGSANQTSYADFKNRPLVNPLNAIGHRPGVQTTAANGAPDHHQAFAYVGLAPSARG